MLDSDSEVFVTFAKSDWFIFLFDVVRLELVELLSLLIFLLSFISDSFEIFNLLFGLLVDRDLILRDAFVHMGNEILVPFDFWNKLVLSILLIHLDFQLELALLNFEFVDLGLQVVAATVDVFDLFLDLNYLVVELFQKCLVFSLLLLRLFELQ